MGKKKVCFMPLVGCLVIGLGVGIITGNYLGYLVIGLGAGAVVLGVTQGENILSK